MLLKKTKLKRKKSTYKLFLNALRKSSRKKIHSASSHGKPFLPSAPQSLLKSLISPPFYLPSTLLMLPNLSMTTGGCFLSNAWRALQWAEPYHLGWSLQLENITAWQPLQSMLPPVHEVSHYPFCFLAEAVNWAEVLHCWRSSPAMAISLSPKTQCKKQLDQLK